MLSKELENTVNVAFKEASEKRHEFMTVEHLLLALLDNAAAAKVLRACGADIEKLRDELTSFLDESTPMLSPKDERETQPTVGFHRVLQRSVIHVQSSGKKEVTGANVVVAIFAERDSQAVYFLNKQSITRLDVVNYISHGISKGHEGGDAIIPDLAIFLFSSMSQLPLVAPSHWTSGNARKKRKPLGNRRRCATL